MSNFRSLFKHSFNYLLANIATKALAFISIPVYTRLLSVEEYGVVSIFLATIGISSVLLTLNLEVAISRYYYDAENLDDFKDFVGTTICLTVIALIVTTLIYIFNLSYISNFLSFDNYLTIAIIPVSLYSIINSIFQQIYNPLLASKKIAIVSSVQTYLAFILSVIIIIIIPNDKYYGYVLGTILSMIILSTYLYKQIKPYCHKCFKVSHVKYILNYALPNIPYALSGVILAQFGRLIVNDYDGFSSAGLYSFAASIGGLMAILINVVHQAWNPYYFEYMNRNDYISINKDYDLIWKVTLISAIFLSLFGYEIGTILAENEYWSSLYLVPFFVLGYVFYQWSYVYLRNTGYSKKIIWNAVAVFISGASNLFLSVYGVSKYGDLGVALAFCVSYLVLLIVSWGINRYILHVYAPKVYDFLKPLFLFAIFWSFSIVLYHINIDYWLTVVIKIFILFSMSLLYLKSYYTQLSVFIKNHFRK